ncbi:HNH/ENDO VII family nuclease [Pseudoalteromonas sp. SG43-6]|nr:HNH/ENDO VII family nuclease [Pseudoalteromonas sp. SG43-6]
MREINWQNLGKQAASEVKAIIKSFRDTLQDISTSWKYDLLLPDSAIDGMQAMVKQLDEVTPQIDQGIKNAANEIGNRVNKALDEFEPPASTGVVGKPKKTVANELEPPKGNDLKGAQSINPNITKPKKLRKISNRLKYLGKTPGKASRTGKKVIAKMKAKGKIRESFKGTEFQASDNQWYPLSQADMAHDPTDAVKWWNTTGRQYGAKSKEVREWMLDSNNYTLDHYSINRSAGAKLNDRYLPPKK